MQHEEYCSCEVCETRGGKTACLTDYESEPNETLFSKNSFNNCSKSNKPSKPCSVEQKIGKGSDCTQDTLVFETVCPMDQSTKCDKEFTMSGMNPPKTAGALSNKFDCCAKYAPCGHWDNCPKEPTEIKNFEPCDSTVTRAPFGPYGPWNKFGPSRFNIPCYNDIKNLFPKRPKCFNGSNKKKEIPMGKMRPWPMSGSCRYAGKPYGPCRPFGAYRSRGPFGLWEQQCDPEIMRRPPTPCQPCWKPVKPGYRPCTPCHRPLYRACNMSKFKKGKCDYNCMVPAKCSKVCEY